jgi:hypothetical protein
VPSAPPKAAPSLARASLIALVGYALAVAGGYGAVWLAERARDPRVADAASGMYAFGDLLGFLLVAGLLSLAPTWVLLRAARGSPRAQGVLGALLLVWAAGGPGAVAGFVVSGWFAGGAGQAGSAWAAAVSGLSVLRLTVCVPSLLLAILGRLGCATPGAQRRANWAVGLEALTCLAVGGWMVRALLPT